MGATPADRRLLADGEMGETALAAALPRCRAQFDAQDGHFFFRRRVADVLGTLVAAVRGGARLGSNPEPNGQPVG
jgi:hypothetical protein